MFFEALIDMNDLDLDELGKIASEAMERSLTPMHFAKVVFTMCEEERQVVHHFLVESGILKKTRAHQLFNSISTILDFMYRAQKQVKAFTKFFGFAPEKTAKQKKRDEAAGKKMKKLHKTKTLQLHDPETKRIKRALEHP